MRIAKWAAIVLGGFLLLVVAGVFVLTSVVDPNRYRAKVEKVVSDIAGRPFVIDGPLEITWFPWLGVRTGAARLEDRATDAGSQTSGVGGRSAPPMLEWQSVFVAAKVLPLLKGRLVIDRIQLESLRLRLRRDAHGHGNWEDLGPRTSAARPAQGPAGSSSAPEIAGLEVRNGEVDYSDEASGLSLNLSNLAFDLGAWRPGQPLAVHARFLVRGSSLPTSGISMEVDSPVLGVLTQPLRVEAPKLAIRVADAEIEGNLTYDQATARGSMSVRVPSVRKLAADLGLNQTMPHDPTTLGPLELTADWSYINGAVAARPLSVKVDDVTFKGWVEHDAPPGTGWRFELHGDRIDLGRYVNVDTTSKKPFELEMLKDINANGSLIFDEALLADTRMSGVQLRFETSAAQGTGGAVRQSLDANHDAVNQ